MPYFYLRVFTLFFALRVFSVVTHYLGPSPWGGPLIMSPDRFIPEALAIEAGVWGLFSGFGALFERGIQKLTSLNNPTLNGATPKNGTVIWRAFYLNWCVALSILSLVDFEVVRWLGQHLTVSYVANFAGARDGQLFSRILSADRLYSTLAALQMIAAAGLGVFSFMRYAKMSGTAPRSTLLTFAAVTVLGLTSPSWLRPSEKRWRRVRPASIGLLEEAWAQASGQDTPENAERAYQDLTDMVWTGSYDQKVIPPDPHYPLYRDSNVGALTPEVFAALPLENKPDVIVIVFETMRGINTGFLGDASSPFAAMPLLHEEITQHARYFPRMHAAGYPSVAGAMGIHLGIWPHHSRIFFSSYLHIQSIAFPEMLRKAGYQSYALLGADPSFSNFTPWFRRWYDDIEYQKQNHHDGPLVDRFIDLYDQKVTASAPLLLTLWTATTHPPYDVPPESGVKPASTNEERYLQAMRYADAHLHRLITHLKASPRYKRTLIFVLGDHSQPVPWQWTHPELIGDLNPGHTWTALAILGGESIAPTPGRDERAVSHVDLAPTLLSALNLKHGNHFFGRDLLRDTKARPVWAFRYGAISLETDDTRQLFRIDSEQARAYRFDPSDLSSYGALENGKRVEIPTRADLLLRHRDTARALAALFSEDRLAPP
jgi:lipoteichoic acid synthase